MATTYLVARRGAMYVIQEGTPGTYVAPTQATDKALRVMEVTYALADAGGPQRVEDDLTPYGGGQIPILDGIAAKVTARLRIPSWPGTQPHDEASFPAMYALLASMPVTIATSSELVVSPSSTYVAGTSPEPVSVTILTAGGNAIALRGCCAVIESIETGDVALEMQVAIYGNVQATIGNTVQTLSGASLTIADVAYTSGDNTWVLSRGGTLTLTGLTGSGSYAVRSAAWVPGMVGEHQIDRTASHGYTLPFVGCPQNSALTLTVTQLDASGAAFEDDMLAQTACSAASLSWGSSASRFALALGSNNRIVSVTPGEDAGVRTFDVELVGAAGSSGNDQWSMTWGTP
jgi:exonuclease VII small subunit